MAIVDGNQRIILQSTPACLTTFMTLLDQCGAHLGVHHLWEENLCHELSTSKGRGTIGGGIHLFCLRGRGEGGGGGEGNKASLRHAIVYAHMHSLTRCHRCSPSEAMEDIRLLNFKS